MWRSPCRRHLPCVRSLLPCADVSCLSIKTLKGKNRDTFFVFAMQCTAKTKICSLTSNIPEMDSVYFTAILISRLPKEIPHLVPQQFCSPSVPIVLPSCIISHSHQSKGKLKTFKSFPSTLPCHSHAFALRSGLVLLSLPESVDVIGQSDLLGFGFTAHR